MLYLYKLTIFFSFLLCLLFFSCTDEINIKINDSANKLLVVDGIVKIREKDSTNSFYLFIKLHESSNYEDEIQKSDTTNAIKNATVALIDSATGDYISFNEIFPGWYGTTSRSIQINHSYKLKIDITNRGQYESSYQHVNPYVSLDSASTLPYSYLSRHGYLFDVISIENPYFLVASFTDPKNTNNYYAYNIYYDDPWVKITNMRLLNDQDFGDGKHIPYEYLWFKASVQESEKTRIEQLCINKNTYHYFKALQNLTQSSSPFNSPPSNPISNITNIKNPSEDVLGFFEICTSTEIISNYKSPLK